MDKKKIIAWALYDLANTAFTSPFVTIFWPLLVTTILYGNESHLGYTFAIGTIIFSVVVPVIGFVSDKTNIRKPLIVAPTIVMILIIMIMPITNLFWNLVLAGVAIVLYNISLSIYNTLLPLLAKDEEIPKVSAFGMASGFIGTITSMLVAYLTLRFFATSGDIETEIGIKAVFPVIAAFFLIFSLPLLFIFKDEKVQKLKVKGKDILVQIFGTLKSLFRIRGMVWFFIYFGLFSNALAAIDIFFYLYAKNEINVKLLDFIILFMFQSVGAATGAMALGKIADKFGAKSMLALSAGIWIVVIGTFMVSRNITTFWIAGLLGSVAFGGSLANARTLFVFLAPNDKIGEFFSYFQIISRLAAVIGPALGGWLIIKHGYNYVLALIMFFIVFCLPFLFKVPDLRSSQNTKY